MKNNTQKQLTEYNRLLKENDDIYHSLARHYGISDCTLWILYIVSESKTNHTQNRICELLSLSKQTVNSALKKLEKDGYIELAPYPGSQKTKLVRLTESGKAFAGGIIDQVEKIEHAAFCQFSAEERIIFLELFEKYVSRLQTECRQLLMTKKNEEEI